MNAKMGSSTNTYDFVPSTDLVQEKDCDTLILHLPGFQKQQLRVQLTKSGVLKISGSKSLGDNKWSSFQKDFPVSPNCDTKKISAKFENGILYVKQPKLAIEQGNNNGKKPQEQDASPPKNRTDESMNPPQANPERTTGQTSGSDDQGKQTNVQDVPEKPLANEEPKPKNEELRKSEDLQKVGTKRRVRENENAVGDDKIADRPTEKLKKARQTMNLVLVVASAFLLGMYICNVTLCSNKAEN